MKYFVFDGNSVPQVAKMDGDKFPELYVNGKWVVYRNVESFADNSKEITEQEAEKLIAEGEKKAVA